MVNHSYVCFPLSKTITLHRCKHSSANRHCCLTPAKMRAQISTMLNQLWEVWSISRQYLFIYSTVSVNRNIVAYNNKYVLVISYCSCSFCQLFSYILWFRYKI